MGEHRFSILYVLILIFGKIVIIKLKRYQVLINEFHCSKL